MNINEFSVNLLRLISSHCASFAIIRGASVREVLTFNDIDCVMSRADLHNLFKCISTFDFQLLNFRSNAFTLEIKVKQRCITLDMHFDMTVRGIKCVHIKYLRHTFLDKDSVRFIKRNLQLSHAVHISVIQNKGIQSKLLFQSTNQKINPKFYSSLDQRAFSKVQANKKYNFVEYLYVCFVLYGFVGLASLCVSMISSTKKSKSTKYLLKFFDSGVANMLETVSIGVDKLGIGIVANRNGELRFALVSKNLSDAFAFISLHNVSAISKYWFSQAIGFLKLGNTAIISPKIFVVKGQRRKLKSIFFGTPSIDRTLLIIYSKGANEFLIKYSKDKNKLETEYRNHRWVRNKGMKNFMLNVGYVKGMLVQPFVHKSYFKATEFLDSKALSSMLKSQSNYSKKRELAAFISRFSSYFKTNQMNFKDFNILIDHLDKYLVEIKLKEYYFSWSHGDLTPWNVIAQGKRFFIIDYEKLNKKHENLVGYDLAHYLISNVLFSGQKIVRSTLEDLEDIWLKRMNIKNKNGVFFKLNLIVCLGNYLKIADNSDENLIQYTWIKNFVSSVDLHEYVHVNG